MESMEVMRAEAVAVWYGSIDTTQELNSTGNLRVDWDCEKGLLEAMRNGERAGLASEATRNADLPPEDDRKIDLAAAEAIFVIGVGFIFLSYQC
uniref:Uncharacterized protein n=1 Tax=Lotus japonicus TaxID=34305 RepID=I3SWL5_LOTJA|nr:unknown [Lotus japonicus]